MESIKVKCPAKINLTLEIVNRREDGFHNINSIMQTINLYDYLTISAQKADKCEIILSGNNSEIPYDNSNLVYKACELYMQNANMNDVCIEIFIEKNIPIAAGLAGGSTDAAGTLWGLNQLFEAYNETEIDKMCAQLGSDLNVCYKGGCQLATSRGEITKKIPSAQYNVTLIKPKNLGISAKEAYTKYATKFEKPKYGNTEKMLISLLDGDDINKYLYNDLEYAIFDDYIELQNIKNTIPNSIMSGSGSTYFVLDNIQNTKLSEEYLIINNLKFIDHGVCAC